MTKQRDVIIFTDIADELDRARTFHPDYHSTHEGYAVILEELDELGDEVKQKAASKERMREETLQVAVTAIRFIQDVCNDK